MKKKKIVFIVIGIILALLLISLLIYFHFHNDKNEIENENDIYFYPVDYEENIFNDSYYLELERDINFGNENLIIAYNQDNRESASEEGMFFIDYFTHVINGEYQDVNSMYVDGYFKTDPEFTMQKLYDIYIKEHSKSTVSYKGNDVESFNFLVSYKIYRNNGTFRDDLVSDSSKPVIYQIIRDENNDLKIFNILEIKYQ